MEKYLIQVTVCNKNYPNYNANIYSLKIKGANFRSIQFKNKNTPLLNNKAPIENENIMQCHIHFR